MTKLNFVLPLALFFAVACSKDKKDVEEPKVDTKTEVDEKPAADPSDEKKTEVVEGELREIILALRRVHFPYDSSTLVPSSRDALADAAAKLGNHPDVAVFVQGHSDARGTTEYNVALGDRRAQIVADYLSRAGIGVDRLKVVSYGEEKPLEASEAANALSKNRRVDFKLMRGNVRLVIEEGTTVDDSGEPISAGTP